MTGMDDLVTWLRAQLDDDERVARAWLPLGNPTDADRDHIARADPMRVLAEVDAKRRLLESHASVVGGQGFRDGDGYGEISPACSACGTHDEYATPWPCYTVRLLALPYADQSGYREEWRP